MILTDEQRMAAELGMDVDNPFGRGSTSTSGIQEYRFGRQSITQTLSKTIDFTGEIHVCRFGGGLKVASSKS